MNLKALGLFFAGLLVLALQAATGVAQSSTDACSLLTPAQVSAAVGAQVSAGVYMTPTFKATCNWTAPGKIITLMTEGTDPFNAGKKPLSPAIQIVPASGIGDDAYYVVTGPMVALITRKGNTAFKTAVYCSNLPLATLESMESKLATQVASEL
ncbi:MAG TPA: hypothetical protein VGG45_08410 [Terracidiphilus sp.]|jgi:hypothetical protein